MNKAETFTQALLAFLLVGVVIFLAPLIGVVVGAFSGWVVGLFFPTTFNLFMTALGLGSLSVWQFGAALGFVGGFFRATFTKNSD